MKNIFVLFILFTFTAFAQADFDFEFDYALFAYDSTSDYLEIYYSFNQATLQLEKSNSNGNLEGLLKIFIKDSVKGDTIVYNQWKVKHEVADTSSRENQVLVGTLGFVIPAGIYTCQISGTDIHNPAKSRLIMEKIKVEPMFRKSLSLSDIQLASKMIQNSENVNSIFYKNTYEVIPIPNVVFSSSNPVMFFYSEIYNLQSESLKSSQLKMIQSVFNSRGKLIKEKIKYLSRNSNTRVEVGSFILSNYPTDTYTLAITLIDSLGNEGISGSKKFFVYNPDVQVADSFEVGTTSVISSAFGALSDEELDDLFEKSKYLATKTEIDKYKKLNTADGKREFMVEFWKTRDNNSSSGQNEFFRKYLQRIELANQRYSSMGKTGWKTDRGRIYLLYDEPSEIERYPNQLETRPYEIWYYNELEGGVYFVFADLTGFSDYTLVHSTKRGELRDDNWSRRIVIR